MSNLNKIIQKMKNSKSNWKFNDCERILLSLGYKKRQGKGSHVIFSIKTDLDSEVIIMANHSPMSEAAIKDVLDAWEKFHQE